MSEYQKFIKNIFPSNKAKTTKAINFSLALKPENRILHFFKKIYYSIFGGEKEAKIIKKESIKNLAFAIKKSLKFIENKLPPEEKKAFAHQVIRNGNTSLVLEYIPPTKLQPNGNYRLITYSFEGLFLLCNEEEIYSFDASPEDTDYLNLKDTCESYSKDEKTLFNSKTEIINTTKKKHASLTCFFIGSMRKKETLMANYKKCELEFGITYNESRTCFFDGSNLLGTNMELLACKMQDEISNKINNIQSKTTQASTPMIVDLVAHSRGCFFTLYLAAQFKHSHPEVKFRLFLSDPVKGPVFNDILSHTIIPSNVEFCHLRYSSSEFLGFLDKTILTIQDSAQTNLYVEYYESGWHNDYSLTFQPQSYFRALDLPPRNSMAIASNHTSELDTKTRKAHNIISTILPTPDAPNQNLIEDEVQNFIAAEIEAEEKLNAKKIKNEKIPDFSPEEINAIAAHANDQIGGYGPLQEAIVKKRNTPSRIEHDVT